MYTRATLLIGLLGVGCAGPEMSAQEFGQVQQELGVLRIYEPQGRSAEVVHHAVDAANRKLFLLEEYTEDCPNISCNTRQVPRVVELDIDSSNGATLVFDGAWLREAPGNVLKGSALTKDGRTAYIGTNFEGDAAVIRRDDGGAPTFALEWLPSQGNSRTAFRISDDGQTVLRVSDQAEVKGPGFSTSFRREEKYFMRSAISPSGRWCALEQAEGSGTPIDTLSIYDCRTGELKHRSAMDRQRQAYYGSGSSHLRFIREDLFLSVELGRLEIYDFDGENLTLRSTFRREDFLQEGENFVEANADAGLTKLAFYTDRARVGVIDVSTGALRAGPTALPLTRPNRDTIVRNADVTLLEGDRLFVRTEAAPAHILQIR